MTEALLLEGAKSVASTIIDILLKEGLSYLNSDLSSKLQNLQTVILPQFQLLIKAAERSNKHKSELELWLKKLKDALYEAEDIVDLYRYQILKEKVSDLNTHPALKQFKKVAQKANSKVCILSPLKIKLRKRLNKLEKIAAEAEKFYELLKIQIGGDTAATDLGSAGQPNITTSLPLSKVFGRDKERDEIIDKYLLDQSEASGAGKCYSVVSIIGIGGAGKTTLAQYIYNDKRVVDHFDIKMWVCVSRKLDVSKHSREMIESATKEKCPRLENLDALQRKLIDLIKSKKVLLVLDDVWSDKTINDIEWENLLSPLAAAAKKGSKILVTTRKDNLPVALVPQYKMPLRDLEEDALISLFMHHAFGSTKAIDIHLQEELKDIGKQIVQKLHNCPLAAKAVGGQLSKKLEANFWRDALDQDNLGDAQQALLWSYQHLSTPLQRCFSFFSIFPKGTIFEAEEIVQLWIAEGFINSSNNSTRLEDIGKLYRAELVSGSFLQRGKYETYSMHDLFHDLAENISKEEYLRIEDDKVEEIPPTIRHLFISDESLWKNNTSFNIPKNLQTLIIVADSVNSSVIDHLFAATKKYQKLRVLDLSWTRTKTLPKSIGVLKHLRYLHLPWNEVVELPMVLGKLHHLQVLITHNYCATTLPRSLKNLINLRHLWGDDEALTRIPYIGRRLTSLQNLPEFHVKKEKGYDIGQLGKLDELQESLTIWNLENIEVKEKAVEANLKNKKYLESLELRWGYCDERDLHREVLEGLQPHPNVTSLSINGYKSPKFPSWLPLQQNLRSLKFHDCTGFEVLPPLSDFFPHCRKLEIWSLPNLRMFPLLPLSLKELEISSCRSLVFLSKEEVKERVEEDIFGGKEKIELILPSTLQSLMIKNCDITDRALSQSLERLTSLKSLVLDSINTITTLPSEEILHHLNSLTTIQISFCSRLELVRGLYALTSLESLVFIKCPCLKLEMVMPAAEGGGRTILPPSLQSLKINSCDITDGALSQSLERLTSLKSLKLRFIKTITTLPSEEILHHLIALTHLKIEACDSLKSIGGLYALPSLESLIFIKCPCLKLEMVMPAGEGGGRTILPPSLQSLKINSCDITEGALSQSLERLTFLKSLKLDGISTITTLPSEEILRHLIALTNLRIAYCDSLKSLGGLYALPSLKELSFVSCPCLELEMVMPAGEGGGRAILPPSLQELHIVRRRSMKSFVAAAGDLPNLTNLGFYNCPSLASMSLSCLTTLKKLNIRNCPGILALPDHLPESLKLIEIQSCPVLEKRCRRPNGEDWPKIAHIPHIYI